MTDHNFYTPEEMEASILSLIAYACKLCSLTGSDWNSLDFILMLTFKTLQIDSTRFFNYFKEISKLEDKINNRDITLFLFDAPLIAKRKKLIIDSFIFNQPLKVYVESKSSQVPGPIKTEEIEKLWGYLDDVMVEVRKKS